ncbi:MAG TPA: ATP-binding protein [Actinobacteria bacterium]|nr:ATP-binding protein [Actinomycetota bacterium]
MNNISDISLETSDNKTDFSIFVRIAVYDSLRSLPRIVDLSFDNVPDFINKTTEEVYGMSHSQGGRIPYTIIKEIIENLIHASFKEIIITVLNNGNKIMISDQGPGIFDKEKAILPGYTSATSKMKKFIRGVGSGLPIVNETIAFSGGMLDIKDNIKNGTVVTLSINTDTAYERVDLSINELPKPDKTGPGRELQENIKTGPPGSGTTESITGKDFSTARDSSASSRGTSPAVKPADEYLLKKLSMRQMKILFLILELEEVGPSKISKELGFSVSTSFRELSFLEKEGLLKTYASGKKRLSKKGAKYLEYYSNNF